MNNDFLQDVIKLANGYGYEIYNIHKNVKEGNKLFKTKQVETISFEVKKTEGEETKW